jgi:hypothetical protein
MGIFDMFFRQRKTFAVQPSDLRMWRNSQRSGSRPSCHCFSSTGKSNPQFHLEEQDTNCDAWKMLNESIDIAASRDSKEFSPGLEMPPELWSQIVTLPSSISKLKSVRKLYLYGTFLVRVPPEIGDMTSLEDLDLYTSYRLHWLPYEVTRCSKLRRSRFSTRALYGNYKFRHPFPQLNRGTSVTNTLTTHCSVCGKELNPATARQVWVSLRVAADALDVLPLLVNACSSQCIERLPSPAFGYVDKPHEGGLELTQPPATIVPPRPDRWLPIPDFPGSGGPGI